MDPITPQFLGPLTETLPTWLAIIGGYLLGSIPFGLLLTHIAGLGDIRNIGSGNIGATNVLRTGNKKLALLTLLLDGGKGAAAALLAGMMHPLLGMFAAAAAFIGHLYPIWLHFKGGKGVATFLGVLLALSLPTGIATALTWALVAAGFRFSSLAALIAALASPFFAFLFSGLPLAILTASLAFLVVMRHEDNIRRLLRGEEPRIGAKKEK
ncbi:glycerol-3-phosphate 1-O-acyltransferase PlsY [Govanella unica]|uniref:glycerol-3-phosphate 1-O-acyltransferase PlsY n=1 Tax=Govanella unica TaxID=2975056 RepID=UPI0023A8D0BE